MFRHFSPKPPKDMWNGFLHFLFYDPNWYLFFFWEMGANVMTQQVKHLLAQPEKLSLIPRTQIQVEGEKWLHRCTLNYTCAAGTACHHPKHTKGSQQIQLKFKTIRKNDLCILLYMLVSLYRVSYIGEFPNFLWKI